MLRNSFWWWYCTNRYNQEYRRVLVELLEKNEDARYLDLGCGDGQLTLKCADKIGTEDIYGFEIFEGNIRKAREVGVQCEWVNLDRGLPSADNSIDIITANQIIERLDNTDTFLKEIYRILKPGEYLIISTNNLASLHWIVMFILGIQPPTADVSDEMNAIRAFGSYKGERMHRRLFTLRGLTKVLRYYGFETEKEVGSYYFPFPVWLARILCWIDKWHATCITVKARKPTTIKDREKAMFEAAHKILATSALLAIVDKMEKEV